MPKELSRDEFAAQPLAEQIKTLGRELKRGDARPLLELSATLRDHAPLSWLSAELLARGWLGEPANREWFATFLVKEEETAVDKVVKALAAKARKALLAKKKSAGPMHTDFSATLVAALQVVPIAHLSSLCLLDRALKHNFPDARTQHVADTRALCVNALRRGNLETVTVDRLAHVRAEAIPELREAAKGSGILQEFDARRKELARRTIDVIGNAPKAVSQANAEELLATRVYTDPGHFLIELLQNAEDSGAKEWKLIFDRDRIVVWHNGTDFDARDVVGVCSIGQTTKRKDQIGQFGVGFKSVYEVTNRPQIFSDVYQFEIADVSIPKLLRNRPKDLPAGGTLLILPLLNPDDPVRSPAAMFKKAQAIDPYVLMTLKSMDVLDFTLTEAGGGPQEHVLTEIHFKDRRQRAIETSSQTGKSKQHYLLEHEPLEWNGPPRPPGRATATELMVGLSTDAEQKPEWHDNPTTVFSFLPTGETSGLHFFIQAHFEVPVDRERVHHDSDWNAWIMSHVPGQLASLTDAVLAGPNPLAGARQLLEVLPVTSELVAPIYTNIADQLKTVLANRALIPCADGQLRTPDTALMASAEMADLFEGRSIAGALIDGSDREFSFVAADLPERSRELCEGLGCQSFNEKDLVRLLERAVAAPPEAKPVFLAEPNAERFGRLAACLLKALNQFPATAKSLQSLAIIPDDEGKLHPAQPNGKVLAPGRGPDTLRKIYAGFRPFVAQALDSMSAGPQPPGHVTDLLDRLKAPRFTTAGLVEDLERVLKPKKGRLASLGETAFPGNRERLDLILAELVKAPPNLQKRARALPLFPVAGGGLARGAENENDRQGLVHTRAVPHTKEMRAFYAGVRPLLEAECEPGPAGRLLVVTEVPAANLELLASDLHAKLFKLNAERIDQLHELLQIVRDSMDRNTRGLFRLLAIWPDQNGKPRPLEGDQAVYLPPTPAIRELLPKVPMLDQEIAAMEHVADMGITKVGVEKVIHALGPNAAPPFVIPAKRDRIEQVQQYLLTSGEKLSTLNRQALAELPVFLDDRDQPRSLYEIVQSSNGALRELYKDTSIRFFLPAGSPSMKLVKHLGLEANITKCDAAMLIKDIGRGYEGENQSPLISDDESTRAVLLFLSSVSGSIPVIAMEKLMKLPLFPDESGAYDVLKNSQAAAKKAGLYAVDAELRPLLRALNMPLLDAELQKSLAPLLKRANISVVKLRTAMDLLESQAVESAPIRDVSVLRAFHELLEDRRRELKKHFPAQTRPGLADGNPRLCKLKIWPSATGDVVSADEAVDPGLLLGLLEEGSKEYKELNRRVLATDAKKRLEELEPMFALCPASRMAQQFVSSFAKPGKALRQQPRFLSTPENIRLVVELIGQRKDFTPEEIGQLPVSDARGRLQFGRLASAGSGTHALLKDQPLQAKLVHPHFNGFKLPAHGEVFQELKTEIILEAVLAPAFLKNDNLRGRFFEWLLSQEHKVLGNPKCRKLIEETPCFLNAGGRFVVPGDLVIDPDLPDLGIDWAPHPDTPKEVLSVLQRQLNIGKPAIGELIKSHIRAAYDAAVKDGNAERARELLVYLAKQLKNRPAAEIQKLLPKLPIQAAQGEFSQPSDLLQPSPMIESYVEKIWQGQHPQPHADYPPECIDFLIKLGVNTKPSVDQLDGVLKAGVNGANMSMGLMGLFAGMKEADWKTLALSERVWVADGNEKVRRPAELFHYTTEIGALIGDDPTQFAHSDIRSLLITPQFIEAVGFRQAKDINLDDVIGRIRLSVKDGALVPFIVYEWLERGLAKGHFDSDQLLSKLDRQPWIYTGSNSFLNHRKVLGVRAMDYFGDRRGYWEEGATRCPELCSLFGIQKEVTDELVQGFMEELGKEVCEHGDQALIQKTPAIPRMLLHCAEHLGRVNGEIKSSAPVLVARPAGKKGSNSVRLLAANDKLLFRSETPTLEAQFASVGKTFYLVETGRGGSNTEDLVRFYDGLGIRRLRDSYTAEVDSKSGKDTTRQSQSDLAGLTSVLRALARVMPRVEKQRDDKLDASGWVYNKRLKSLGGAAEIRVIRDLSVRMTLEGVGSISAPETARFDPKEGVLLVEDEALGNLSGNLMGLAEGLLPTIYEGNGGEGLVDIIELLLARSNLKAMNAYLDRKHYPAMQMEEEPQDLLIERLGEVLDYSLHYKLAKRFPELAGLDFSAWRQQALHEKISALGDKKPKAAATEAAGILLEAVGLKSPGTDLLEAMVAIFSASSINAIPGSVFTVPVAPQPEVELSEIETMTPETETEGWDKPESPSRSEDRIEEEKSGSRFNPFSWFGKKDQEPEPEPEPPKPVWEPEPAVLPPVIEAEPGMGFSLFDKVSRFFGNDEPDVVDSGSSSSSGTAVIPDWRSGRNNLKPINSIGAQLDISGEDLEAIDSGGHVDDCPDKAPAGFVFDPTPLPNPYLYGIQVLGATFNPGNQEWTPVGAPTLSHLRQLPATGHKVIFKGTLQPGKSQLPTPMYSRLRGQPKVLSGNPRCLGEVSRRTDGGYEIKVTGGSQLYVEYEVELLRPPDLDQESRNALNPTLCRPTATVDSLPEEVQNWIADIRRQNLTQLAMAMEAAKFVQLRYCYDYHFKKSAKAQRKLSQLKPGRGNHHLEVMHAASDGRYLGRGVCMELNMMVVELIRHLGVPAVVATGWMFKGINVTDPSHLYAVAILSMGGKVYPMPLEAATGERTRNLAEPRESMGGRNVIERNAPPVPNIAGAWSVDSLHNGASSADIGGASRFSAELNANVSKGQRIRAKNLARAINLVCKKLKRRPPAAKVKKLLANPANHKLEEELLGKLEGYLGNKNAAAYLLALLRGEYNSVPKLPREIHQLAKKGIVRIESVQFFSAELDE